MYEKKCKQVSQVFYFLKKLQMFSESLIIIQKCKLTTAFSTCHWFYTVTKPILIISTLDILFKFHA